MFERHVSSISSYWDPYYDQHLMLDKIALNLLYIQTSSDVDRGWILATHEIKDQLSSLQSNGNKKEVCFAEQIVRVVVK